MQTSPDIRRHPPISASSSKPKHADREPSKHELWKRFFVAVGGLMVAFLAAVFSTVFRQAGNAWATAILASLALLLAGFVGITSVPYLMRRIVGRRVKDAFDYQITREGVIYLILVLVVGVAALNTGNNLLFIVVAAMLAGIIVSGMASAWMLRGLEVEVALPQHVFAGERMLSRLSVRNWRRLPAFSISVTPPKSRPVRRFRWERRNFSIPRKRKAWLQLPDLALRIVSEHQTQDVIFSQTEYFPYLPAATASPRDVELLLPKRGRYAQDTFGLSTRFPFSFLIKTRRVGISYPGTSGLQGKGRSTGELVVYPTVEPTDELFEVLPTITGELESYIRGRGHDLYRIREYLPEDSSRHVDWKATARTGTLQIREFTREDQRKLRIVFDNPAPGEVSQAAYERAVALAASLAWHFSNEMADLTFNAPQLNGSDLYEFLHYLALVDPANGKANRESVLDNLPVTSDYNIVLTARPRGSIPTALWGCSYFLFLQD